MALNLSNDTADLFGGDFQSPAQKLQAATNIYNSLAQRPVYIPDRRDKQVYVAGSQPATRTVSPLGGVGSRRGYVSRRSGYVSKSPGYYDDLNDFIAGLDTEIPELAEAPELDLPEFDMPGFDESRAEYYAEKAAAHPLAMQKQGLRSALGAARGQENPNVAKSLQRSALRGYGEGLGSILSSARREGLNQYTTSEYNPSVTEARMNFQTDQAEAMQRWNQAVQDRNREYLRDLEEYRTNRNLRNTLKPQTFGSLSRKPFTGGLWANA